MRLDSALALTFKDDASRFLKSAAAAALNTQQVSVQTQPSGPINAGASLQRCSVGFNAIKSH